MLSATVILLNLALPVQVLESPVERGSSPATTELRATEVLCIDADPEHPNLGTSVRVLGDVDGDGTLDLALAARESSFIGAFSGASGEPLWGKKGPWCFRDIARSLVALDDLNGDGVPDLAVGYPQRIGHNSAAWSRAWLLSGADGSELRTLKGDCETVPLGGTDLFGRAVAAAGDLDGDGVPDLWVGAPGGPAVGGDGRITAFSGATGAELRHLDAPRGEFFGGHVVSLGDLDGDGVRDLAVTSSWGEVWLHFLSGASLAPLHPLPPEPRAGNANSLASVGDVDGDGLEDLALGFTPRSENSSRPRTVLVFSSGTGEPLIELPCTPAARGFGMALCGLPDLDGDGVPELAVGSPYSGNEGHGRVEVLSLATGQTLLTIHGSRRVGYFGTSLDAADLDGDGAIELIVGEPGDDDAVRSSAAVWAGSVHVYSLTQQPASPQPSGHPASERDEGGCHKYKRCQE